ncbi:PAS domain S-box protein [Polaromonas sp.]|uniref:PAS domain S-box protein n=1 Tax=Polaromonas sp. TaxID=1869339 RepID=UPI00356579D7
MQPTERDLRERVLELTRLTESLQQQVKQPASQAPGDPAGGQHFISAFENAAISMAVLDLDARRLRVNRAFCTLFGYSREELLAPGARDVTHPDDVAEALVQRKRALASEIDTYQREKRYLHKSGHIVWGHLTCSLVRDAGGQPLHFISQLQDITGRKSAEQVLIKASTSNADLLRTIQRVLKLPAEAAAGDGKAG